MPGLRQSMNFMGLLCHFEKFPQIYCLHICVKNDIKITGKRQKNFAKTKVLQFYCPTPEL